LLKETAMLGKIWKKLSGRKQPGNTTIVTSAAKQCLQVDGLPAFSFADHVETASGLPYANWDAVFAWLEQSDDDKIKAAGWLAAERNWLLMMRDGLGQGYFLRETGDIFLLSPQTDADAAKTISFMTRTNQRVAWVLEELADVGEWGKDVLLLTRDEEDYYRYISYYYPEEGEFAFSDGMHIADGCAHFVCVADALGEIESTIVHEMTHGALAHLALPLWLDEGLAVNTEHRLAGQSSPVYSQSEMRDRHLSFWREAEIQQFWSGESFSRPDDGNMLSYDLARVLIAHLARDWEAFKRFVAEADYADAGAASARKHLGVSLGALVAGLLERRHALSWEPVVVQEA
jgi:hypothetical protein